MIKWHKAKNGCRGGRMEGSLQKLSDEQLCTLASGGDDAAMAELIKRIMPLAGAKAAMYNHPDLHRDDLLQEGMLGFITAVNTYDPEKNASFRTYAGVCINNRIVSMLRRRSSQRNIPPDLVSSIDDEGDSVSDYSSDPQEIFSEYEDMMHLQFLLDEKLTKLEKDVLLCRARGMSYEDIASKLGTSAKSVDNALRRARKKLNQEN